MWRLEQLLLPQHDCATTIVPNDVERILTDINADYGNRTLCCRSHGVLLVLAPLASLSLAGQEHGRIPQCSGPFNLILAARSSQTPFATRAQHAILVFERTNPDDRRPVIATFDGRLDASAAYD